MISNNDKFISHYFTKYQLNILHISRFSNSYITIILQKVETDLVISENNLYYNK